MRRNAILAALTLGGLLFAPTAVPGQSISVSPSNVALSPTTPAAAGRQSSWLRVVDLVVGLPGSGTRMTGAAYEVWVGVSAEATLSTPGPIVLATDPPYGDANGGESVRVLGFGMPSDVAPAVNFGDDPGVPASGVTIESNTSLLVTTPPGKNVFGNPLAEVDVELVSVIGNAMLPDGFVYTPAFVETEPTHVGDFLHTALLMPPGSLYGISWGKAIPNFAVPIPPFAGQLELINPLVSVTPLLFSPSGEETWLLPIVNDPTIAGAVMQFQALAITNLQPLAGSFTNRLLVPVLAP